MARVVEPNPPGRKIRPTDERLITGTAGRTIKFDKDGNAQDGAGPVDATLWGLSAAGTASANSAVIADLAADIEARSYNENSVYKTLEPVTVPLGSFNLASTIDFNFGAARIGGYSTAWANGSWLNFPADTTGLRVQRIDTSGATTTDEVFHVAGDGSHFTGLTLTGSGTDKTKHGIHMRARADVEHSRIYDFPGNGINIVADVEPGPSHGNANCFSIHRSRITHCENGIFASGGDANAGIILGTDASYNNRFGVYENSFLGNCYVGLHLDANGIMAGSTPCLCSYSGNRYGVIFGQEVWCSTNAPTGTTADNQGWYYQGAGGADAGNNIIAWESGLTWTSGGSIYCVGTNNASTFIGCYHEGGQGNPQVNAPGMIIGGILSTIPNVGSAPVLSAQLGRLWLNGTGLEADLGIETHGTLTVDGALNYIGPRSGTAANNILHLDTTSNYNGVYCRSWSGGVSQIDGEFGSQRDVGLFFYTTKPSVRFGAGGAWAFKATAAGLEIESGKVLNFASLTNAADDTAAAAAGVTVGSVYRNGSQLMVRVA